MPLNIYTSNRMENLTVALAKTLARPLSAPFKPEIIVVQSRGMERWLAMELAKQFGVWANCIYPFPNAMIQQLFGLLLPELSRSATFAPEVMSWKIIDRLPELLDRQEFSPLQHYLNDDRDGLKRFQLAEKIADVFDQYTMFRPQMIEAWEGGMQPSPEEEWQAALWRELTADCQGQHQGQLAAAYHLRTITNAVIPPLFPERISLFGISYLPKYHLDILAATARFSEVNLFLLSPTREYWADICSNQEQSSLTLEERQYVVAGNP
ncbi:MAG: exodeoxyribonuclease V subunit gamma, partial [Desulfuromonadales bacterium]|nr:exodeoxyribonuclease V subunit gamma [Desulfuromonadales bacterium]